MTRGRKALLLLQPRTPDSHPRPRAQCDPRSAPRHRTRPRGAPCADASLSGNQHPVRGRRGSARWIAPTGLWNQPIWTFSTHRYQKCATPGSPGIRMSSGEQKLAARILL